MKVSSLTNDSQNKENNVCSRPFKYLKGRLKQYINTDKKKIEQLECLQNRCYEDGPCDLCAKTSVIRIESETNLIINVNIIKNITPTDNGCFNSTFMYLIHKFMILIIVFQILYRIQLKSQIYERRCLAPPNVSNYYLCVRIQECIYTTLMFD